MKRMQVQCILCDKIDTIDDNSYEAKRMINKHISTYLCPTCYDRIAEKTKKRHETGKFKLYRPPNNNSHFPTNKA